MSDHGTDPNPPAEDGDDTHEAERAVAEAPETVPDAYQQALDDQA